MAMLLTPADRDAIECRKLDFKWQLHDIDALEQSSPALFPAGLIAKRSLLLDELAELQFALDC